MKTYSLIYVILFLLLGCSTGEKKVNAVSNDSSVENSIRNLASNTFERDIIQNHYDGFARKSISKRFRVDGSSITVHQTSRGHSWLVKDGKYSCEFTHSSWTIYSYVQLLCFDSNSQVVAKFPFKKEGTYWSVEDGKVVPRDCTDPYGCW